MIKFFIERKYPLLRELRILIETKKNLQTQLSEFAKNLSALNGAIKNAPPHSIQLEIANENLLKEKRKYRKIIDELNESQDLFIKTQERVYAEIPKKVLKKYEKILDSIN